ncbi:acyl-CoA dehydrogenase/oxidase [Zopfochytrium polystomum]|nr:acyl-CoA dehydrogenase/oxidase [Zopfochytrium polystomum]
MAPSSKTFSRDDVAKHNKPDDLWCIIDSVVYDLTDFADSHPGSAVVLWAVAGKDATEQFYGLHRQEVLAKYKRLAVGSIAGEKPQILALAPGTYSTVPYAENSSVQKLPSPYYNATHHAFRNALREFVDTELMPESVALESMGERPDDEMYLKMGKFNLIACRLGPGDHLKGLTLPGGVKPEEFDYFHELIAHEEMCRLGIYNFAEGLSSGMVIGLPPVIKFGPKWMQEKIVPPILRGEKKICLAISDPGAGSDVSNISCVAEKTPDGKFFIVNGVKKWITNGTFCDYFTTAVRTGAKGMGGISVLLIERSEGVSTKIIKTSGTTSAGTAYVMFENVKVPVENLIGGENKGFAVVMANFNHERWGMAVGCARAARLVTEECFKWACQRKVFGKPLVEQPVIRFKLGQMISDVEAIQAYCESITYQMTKMSFKDQNLLLAGPIALLKYRATRMSYNVSDNAVQIFGGRALTRSGMGRVIEQFQRTNKFGAILGGAEEVMADLGVRQALKFFPKNARL